jgi:hypothetical protein
MRHMNFARWVILLSVLGSLVLGYTGFGWHRKRVRLDEALEVEVPKLAQDIQVNSIKLVSLTRERDRTGFKTTSDPQEYIRRIAGTERTIALGSVKIREGEANRQSGLVDKTYTIEPQEEKQGFQRTKIGNFMYKLEEDSGRMRVTSIHMEPAQKVRDPSQIPADVWRYNVVVTSREKIEEE